MEMNDSVVREALLTAKRNGHKRLVIIVDNYKFSFAPDNGNNPGWLYVVYKGQYMGKMKDKNFKLSDTLLNDEAAILSLGELLEADSSLLYQKIVKSGRATGICGCCGRTLTNGISIKLGIGPICREKYGFFSPEIEEVADEKLIEAYGL